MKKIFFLAAMLSFLAIYSCQDNAVPENENTETSTDEGTITYDGTETEPKIGDYYYSDGTWSDGGLRKLLADGTMEWAEPKPEPESDKTLIAIVFHAGHHANDASDYSATGIGQQKCQGYAVALQNATSSDCMWGVYGTELGCCPTDGSGDNYSTPDIDWSGYAWTQKIITAAGGKEKLNATAQSGYPATYYAVVDYENNKAQAPANSSGWFLPSIGQMWNVYQNRTSVLLCLTARQEYQAYRMIGTGPPRSSTPVRRTTFFV